jgi:hypothetical protein
MKNLRVFRSFQAGIGFPHIAAGENGEGQAILMPRVATIQGSRSDGVFRQTDRSECQWPPSVGGWGVAVDLFEKKRNEVLQVIEKIKQWEG